MSLSPTQSSVETSSTLTSSYRLSSPLSLSTELSSETLASTHGTYFLQIIIYAFHHSILHFHAGLMVQSAQDNKDVFFFHLKMPGSSEPKRKDPKPSLMSQYKLIPIPIFIRESQISELHELLRSAIFPFYHNGPEWLNLALSWLEDWGFLSEHMGARCYSRMCSAIYHYSSGEVGVPWDTLRGEVNVDVLDGPTQVVVLKQPLANGLDNHTELVWGRCPVGYSKRRSQY